MRKHLLLLLFLFVAIVCQAQTVYKTKTGAKYHVQTCRYLKSSFQTTVAEAQAEGLTACSVCKPASAATTNAVQRQESSTTPAVRAVTTSSSRSSSGSVQCSGTTKAGNRCKRMTTSSNGRCYQH
ncbi:MAG TPA: hypothetical protein VIG72_14810 [Pontibacter sp.]